MLRHQLTYLGRPGQKAVKWAYVCEDRRLGGRDALLCCSGGRPASAASGHHAVNGSRSLQEMQSEQLRKTYRGLTSHSNESFTGLDAKQRATMPYSSTTHYLRQVHGLEKPPKSSDPPLTGVCEFSHGSWRRGIVASGVRCMDGWVTVFGRVHHLSM